MKRFVEDIGRRFVATALFYHGFTRFSRQIFRAFVLLKPFNPAVFIVLTRQVYFTGIQILPTFIMLSLAIGIGIIGVLTQMMINIGASDSVGPFLTTFFVREAAPLITATLFALRSSTAITAEIALMKLNREIETLRSLEVDPHDYLYAPRILSGMICMLALSTIFIYVGILGGYSIMGIFLDTTLDVIVAQMYDTLTVRDILCFIFKVTAWGYLLFAIPIYSALEVQASTFEIPIALLRGMMRLFYAGILVEAIGFMV